MPKFESTLHLSNYFILIQAIMLFGSMISVCYLPFSGLIKAISIIGLLGYSGWNLYGHLQWQGIGQDMDGWYLQKAGEKIPISLSGDSTITSFVSILRFKQEGKFLKQSCMIFKDALSAVMYRELVVRIKHFRSS